MRESLAYFYDDIFYKSSKVKDDKIFQEGLASIKRSPHQDFQFNLVYDDALDNFNKWFAGDDSVELLCNWSDLGKGWSRYSDPGEIQ